VEPKAPVPRSFQFSKVKYGIRTGIQIPEAAYRYLPPDHSILGTEYISTGIIGMSSLWTSPSKINQLYLHLIPLPPTHSLRTVWGNPP
jgi:hypothetical protein